MAKEMIVVEGGTPLAGEVRVSGAKNSALKLIAASILGAGESVIHNVPLISDITVMSKAVSYTHLDVYKRQVRCRESWGF